MRVGRAAAMRVGRAAAAALLLAASPASPQDVAPGCFNSAGDANCATLVSAVGGELSHCTQTLKAGLRVEDVCARSCGRCGVLPEEGAEAACFASEFQPGQPYFANCCGVPLNFAGGTPLGCSTGDCTVCWGGDPVAAGLFETCCLDQDPCRSKDCGHGTCVSSGFSSTCHCEPGWVGADGLEGRTTGALAPFCDTWHGFHTDPFRRIDTADGNLYTRSDFLSNYGGSNEWDSAAGLEGVCW